MAFFRRILTPLAVVLSLCFAVSSVQAKITWNPQTGYSSTSSDLGSLRPEQALQALKLMNEARRLEDRGRTSAALRRYRRVDKKYRYSVYAPEAYYRSGLIYLSRKSYQHAFSAFETAIHLYPNFDRFDKVISEEYKIANDLVHGAHGRWFFGLLPGFSNRERGVAYFEAIIQNAPYSDYAPLSLMNISKALIRMKENLAAISSLSRLINTYPNSMLTPDAYLLLAKTYAKTVQGPAYDQGATREAITHYEDFLILFPNDPKVGEAEKGLAKVKDLMAQSKIVMANFYNYRRHNYVAARILYNDAITVSPKSETAKKARKILAEIKPKLEKERKAFEKMLKKMSSPEFRKPRRKKFLWLF